MTDLSYGDFHRGSRHRLRRSHSIRPLLLNGSVRRGPSSAAIDVGARGPDSNVPIGRRRSTRTREPASAPTIPLFGSASRSPPLNATHRLPCAAWLNARRHRDDPSEPVAHRLHGQPAYAVATHATECPARGDPQRKPSPCLIFTTPIPQHLSEQHLSKRSHEDDHRCRVPKTHEREGDSIESLCPRSSRISVIQMERERVRALDHDRHNADQGAHVQLVRIGEP